MKNIVKENLNDIFYLKEEIGDKGFEDRVIREKKPTTFYLFC